MKKRIMILCLIFVIIVSLININLLLFQKSYPYKITGAAGVTTATVAFTIIGEQNIYILSPLNQTYNFSIGDPNYTLNLEVRSDFTVNNWAYTLWDLKHNQVVNSSVAFIPNTTINAVRWDNMLVVEAENSTGDVINKSVVFYVYIPNSAPYFGAINDTLFVCENDPLSYFFNVTDVDEQTLQLSLTPTDPFYLDTIFTSDSVQTSDIELFSGVITDQQATNGSTSQALKRYSIGWLNYPETIEVTDYEYSDTAYTNITVIRENDAPIISTIGVQTVYTQGDNSNFYKQVSVYDEEDGNENSSDISFNITFPGSAHLFNITNDGIMNFTPSSSQVGVYNITVCVNDTGIYSPHENISVLCGQTGGPIITCQNFSLTVTNDNRAPTITSYYPLNLSFSASSTDTLYFNITTYDADRTIPDAYWYIDGTLIEYDSGSLFDEFSYSFGCGAASGNRTIKVEITDGLLNDSLEWAVEINSVVCPPPSAGGGAGGGEVSSICQKKWVCSIWGICQHAQTSLDIGLLTGEDYRKVIEGCSRNYWGGDLCGVQIRDCFDTNNCNDTSHKPEEFQACHYTIEPSCNDKIKNCHDGACELLVDCGGPCSACPSCSDKIQNQGEEGIDCGGPCPWKCKEELPLLKRVNKGFLLFILLILIILIIIAIREYKKIRKYQENLKRGV